MGEGGEGEGSERGCWQEEEDIKEYDIDERERREKTALMSEVDRGNALTNQKYRNLEQLQEEGSKTV